MNEQIERTSDYKKARLIYTIELLVFVALFITLGILFITRIIGVADWKRIVFTYLTLAGGLWLIADFIWALASKKRRKKVALIDKILVLPAATFLIGFDIFALVNNYVHSSLSADSPIILTYQLVIGIDMLYLSTVYLFQAIYHWKHPIPGLVEIDELSKKLDAEEKAKQENENNKKDEISDAESISDDK